MYQTKAGQTIYSAWQSRVPSPVELRCMMASVLGSHAQGFIIGPQMQSAQARTQWALWASPEGTCQMWKALSCRATRWSPSDLYRGSLPSERATPAEPVPVVVPYLPHPRPPYWQAEVRHAPPCRPATAHNDTTGDRRC